eukprot:CAMPEP_0177613716 /NCGR_PEP_ID=MMETSP0419_2-20121207/22181_1 /TAXON_ID=582737 /ORGANISM="Tetraselmis sp., Strain GSL018" /LENGTH=193 /DNA_ID=CAMNT_0019110547 /DNA_START=689 /DNA_END=1270 /DNA_ORIENTATION=-
MAEVDSPHRGVHADESVGADQLFEVPEAYKRIPAPRGKVLAGGVECNAVAAGAVCLQGAHELHGRVRHHLDAPAVAGDEEAGPAPAPRDLVDLVGVLVRLCDLELPHVHEGNVVVAAARGDGAAVGAPHDVDLLAASCDALRALVAPRVPQADGLVAGGRDEAVGMRRVPAEGVDRLRVALQLNLGLGKLALA